jgi:hypothetical protein
VDGVLIHRGTQNEPNNPTPKEKRVIRIAGGAVGIVSLAAVLPVAFNMFAYFYFLVSGAVVNAQKVDVTCTLPENTVFVGTTDTGASFTLDTADDTAGLSREIFGGVMVGMISDGLGKRI